MYSYSITVTVRPLPWSSTEQALTELFSPQRAQLPFHADCVLSLATPEHSPMKMLTYVMNSATGIPVRNT